ncbi:MAG: UDP-3-O-(3-hydroxymyristoyl)glucosamine N-acyltransferase [Proteobacteria bacterium]|nr:UDP-3-O-(3-hydroxymyristoyl)glucosamine N-acyltransferase [Pseudomonadota bacterium]
MSLTIAALTAHFGLPTPPKGAELELRAVKPLEEAGPNDLSFLDNPAYKEAARKTRAGAVLVRPADVSLLPDATIALTTNHPYVAFAKALQLLYPQPVLAPGISEFAVVSSSATIHPTARVEPYAVIYAGTTVGEGVHIGAHAVIGQGVTIGQGTRIGAHVTLQKVSLGNNCLIHPGVRVGQDGFGFAVAPAAAGELELIKVPQVGFVTIGHGVEIGANTTVDCGALGNTVIEDDVKIDNQVQIGHNVHIGKGTRVVAQVGIAGSASLGKYTVIGGQSGIAGHLAIADKVMVAARSAVTKTITQAGAVVAGIPAVPINEWRRQVAAIARITKNRVQPMPAQASAAPASPITATEDTESDPHTGNPFA